MQVSTDSRNDWEKLRRIDLWHLADAWNVQYPPGATKVDMINLLSANQVNPNDPRGAFEWDEVHSQDEMGRPVISRYPKRKAHATASQNIDYDAIMDKQAQEEMESENKTLKDEVAELKAMMAELLKAQGDAPTLDDAPHLGDKDKEKISASSEVKTYSEMKFQELRKLAKLKGLVIQNTDKKIDVIAKLEALGEQDVTTSD